MKSLFVVLTLIIIVLPIIGVADVILRKFDGNTPDWQYWLICLWSVAAVPHHFVARRLNEEVKP
jgi:hypothetical protein